MQTSTITRKSCLKTLKIILKSLSLFLSPFPFKSIKFSPSYFLYSCFFISFLMTPFSTFAIDAKAAIDAKEIKEIKTSKVVGISQIVEHPALNDVRLGIIESLQKNGFEQNKNLKIIYENAQGNMAVSSQIANKLLSEPLDVGIAISTPSSQSLFFAAQRNQKNLPIVFTAVSDPIAAKLEPGKNHYPITGVTDAPNLEGLLEVINAMMPNIKTLGIMYNPSEINSVSTVNRLKKLLNEKGIQAKEVTVNNTNDVPGATQSLIGKVDALYFPQDNTVVSAIESVLKVTHRSAPVLPVILPIFTSDPLLVKQGVLAAVGYDYKEIGKETGEVVARILRGEAANNIPIENPSHLKTVVNSLLAKQLGFTIPHTLKLSTIELMPGN